MKTNLYFLRIFVCFVIFSFVSVFAYSQHKDYEVKLWIHDFADSTIYVRGAFGERTNLLLDSLKMKNDGSFELKGNYRQGIVVVSSAKEDMFSFVLDKESKFEITIFPDGFYEVKGSIENDRYLEYQKMNKEYRLTLYQCNQGMKNHPESKDTLQKVASQAKLKFEKYQNDFYKNYPENIMSVLVKAVTPPQMPSKYFDARGEVKKETGLEYAYLYRTHYWDSFDFSDERIIGTPYFYKKFQTYIDQITMQNADSVFSAFKSFVDLANSRNGELYSNYIIELYLSKLPRLPFSFNEQLYVQIVDSLLNDKYTPWLSMVEKEFHQTRIEEIRKFLPGKPFCDIMAQSSDGSMLRLYDLKSRYTVVFFWSAGCETCKKGMQELKEFYQQAKDKYDIKVFSVEMGGDIEKTRKELAEIPADWVVLQANPEQIEKQYGLDISHTPEIYVLDGEKRVLNKTAVSAHIKAVIEQSETELVKHRNK